MAIIIPGETPRIEEENIPKIEIPETYGEPKAPRIDHAEQKREYEAKKYEETRKKAEENQPKFKNKKESDFSAGGLPIIGQKIETPSIISNEVKETTREKPIINTPKIEVVSNFGDRRSQEDEVARRNIVKNVEARRDVREKIIEGEIPSSVELSKLTDNERGEKNEYQESIKVRSQGEIKIDNEDRLIGIAKEMAEKKEETGKTKYLEAVDVYRVVTGQELAPKVKEKVAEESKAQKLKIISKAEFLTPERLAKTAEKIKQREISSAIEERWDSLSDKEKAMYTMDNGQPDMQKFADTLEMKRQALEAKGVDMPREAYYQMIQSGYEPDKIQVRGFFGRLFGRSDIKMPDNLLKTIKPMSKNDLQGLIYRSETNFNKSAERDAQAELDTIVNRGQKRIQGLREKCARDVLAETADQIEEARKPKLEEQPKPVEAKKPKLEIVYEIGQKRTPEFLKEMTKLKRELSKDIKKREKIKEQIFTLSDRKKKGEVLTQKEVAILRAYENLKEVA